MGRVEELIRKLNKWSYEYYTLDNPTVSDAEYDKAYDELLLLEKESGVVLPDSPTRRVGGEILKGFSSYKHRARLYSLDKCKTHEELEKLGGGLIFGENIIVVPKQELQDKGIIISGHNDHRIVMAMSLILSKTGGTIQGIEAVRKSYPGFFEDVKKLGAEVEIK